MKVLNIFIHTPSYWGPDPIKCSTVFSVFKQKIADISAAVGVLFENSSDLSSGPAPLSESDEFSKSTPMVIDIRRCENSTFPIQGYTYWDFESILLLT